MARAQSQFLRIYDAAGVTYQRWQSFYANDAVLLSGQRWSYVPFTADGITAGNSGDESSIAITAPATGEVCDAFELALFHGRLAELTIYQFDALAGTTAPVSSQVVVGSFTGQVVGGSGSLTSLTIQLGSAISPVGSQVPPRSYTTGIIGVGCRL